MIEHHSHRPAFGGAHGYDETIRFQSFPRRRVPTALSPDDEVRRRQPRPGCAPFADATTRHGRPSLYYKLSNTESSSRIINSLVVLTVLTFLGDSSTSLYTSITGAVLIAVDTDSTHDRRSDEYNVVPCSGRITQRCFPVSRTYRWGTLLIAVSACTPCNVL